MQKNVYTSNATRQPTSGSSVPSTNPRLKTASEVSLYLLQQVQARISKLQNTPNSASDLNDEDSTELQMIMANYTTLLQALSNIQKIIEDMNESNVQNLKQ
jgi:hypothetical protein